MKILLFGDASNCHRALATGLQRLGHEVVVASDGTKWMQTQRDIDLSRPLPGKPGGAALWLKAKALQAMDRLSCYDVVAVSNPVVLHLRPHRCLSMFDWLKAHNGSIFLTALGSDTAYVQECVDPAGRLAYNEFRHHGQLAPHALKHPEIEHNWLSEPLTGLCRHVYDEVDGAVSVLYDYHVALQRVIEPARLAYGGIPIDTKSIEPVKIEDCPQRVLFLLGRHRDRKDIKGTDRFEAALRMALDRHPGRAELQIIENIPYNEYVSRMRQAHVVVDQAYSYTPATNALLAMANGLVTVSGAENAYYDFIGESDNRPIINAPLDVQAMTAVFEDIITHPETLAARGAAGRRFVEKHNDVDVVAARFADFWTNRIEAKKA